MRARNGKSTRARKGKSTRKTEEIPLSEVVCTISGIFARFFSFAGARVDFPLGALIGISGVSKIPDSGLLGEGDENLSG
jgi:hypothetical protein